MQETTFNSPCQLNDNAAYFNSHLWLDAIYAESTHKNFLKNFNFNSLTTINSINDLQICIQYKFKNSDLLINALTQSTFFYEFKHINNSSICSNERLEFLGDSLVNFLIAKILFNLYPNSNEGELSKLRGALVNKVSLSQLAISISLGDNLLLGKGEHQKAGRMKASLLADAFEALIAAVYIDSGENVEVLEKTLRIIIEKYETRSKKNFFSLDNLESFDSKTQLQELSVSLFQILPTYKSTEEKNGFTVELWIGDRKLANAFGISKKKLEKELARFVLDEKLYQL